MPLGGNAPAFALLPAKGQYALRLRLLRRLPEGSRQAPQCAFARCAHARLRLGLRATQARLRRAFGRPPLGGGRCSIPFPASALRIAFAKSPVMYKNAPPFAKTPLRQKDTEMPNTKKQNACEIKNNDSGKSAAALASAPGGGKDSLPAQTCDYPADIAGDFDGDPSPEAMDDMIGEAFPDIEITDPDLLPDPCLMPDGGAPSSRAPHYETVSVDVDSPSDMLALRDAFKPKYYAASASDPLAIYLSHIRNHPILDAESQQKLAVRYKENNDVDAAQMLVLTNLRLVVKIAREYKRRWANLLELIQEGNVGLSEAIRRYDPFRHVKFTSYAQYWIRAMILNYLMNHFQPIKIGSTRAGRKLFYNLRKARSQLIQDGYSNPTPALVAEKLGVSEQDVIDVSRQLDQPAVSIDQTAPGHETVTIGELIKDDAQSPEEAVENADFYAKVREIMTSFAQTIKDPREQALWNRRLMADDPITLADLGAEFNVSKERMRQIEARLKDRFKDYISQRIDGDIGTFIDV